MNSKYKARKVPDCTIGVSRPVRRRNRRWMEAGQRILNCSGIKNSKRESKDRQVWTGYIPETWTDIRMLRQRRRRRRRCRKEEKDNSEQTVDVKNC